jgi:exosortase/archaeosortase family protein
VACCCFGWDTDVPRSADQDSVVIIDRGRSARWLAAGMLLLAGAAFIAAAGPWRGVEAALAGHTIHLVTGQTTIAVPTSHMLILYKGSAVESILVLTSECSVAYLLAALLIGSAPLMLLRQLSPWRTAMAVAVTATILTLVNVARLAAIGVTVSVWGRGPGLEIAHTYLGSVLTVAGAVGAGVALAAVLVGRRKTRSRAVA